MYFLFFNSFLITVCGKKYVDGGNGRGFEGSTPTQLNEYPWLCLIENSASEYDLVGSLINDRYVLSAVHEEIPYVYLFIYSFIT